MFSRLGVPPWAVAAPPVAGPRHPNPPAGHLSLAQLIIVAVALTLLNAAKPVTMDDPSYLLHARWIAAHPLDPYGGEMFVYQTYGPALHNNAPPVAVYWLGLGNGLLGDRPFLLKLWLLPWALLLGVALRELLARFAPGAGAPLLWATLLSPALLPGFNFMLDVPALAMILAAVALFARAGERNAPGAAILAGLAAGLAMQTKYTGVTAPAAILAYGLVARRLRLALAACVVAVAVFAGWEALMLARYGDSQLLNYLGRRASGASGEPRLNLLRPLFRLTGALAAGLVPLCMVALGRSRRAVVLAGAAVAGAFAAYALLPGHIVTLLDRVTGGRVVNFENATLGLAALATLLLLGLVVLRAARSRDPHPRFLQAWLAIEIAAYFMVSTGPAARRVYGVLAVLGLLVAHALSRHLALVPERRGLLRGAAAFGVLAGLVFWAADCDEALAQRRDVGRVVARIAREAGEPGVEPGATWYVGNHFGGFQFYAPRAGLRPVLTGRSTLRRGDWLVLPPFVDEKYLRLDRSRLDPVATLAPVFRLPVTTRYSYYGGKRPLRRVDTGWVAVTIYRVTGDGIVVQEDLLPR